ncbi:MAG TPA: OmpA family protein [Verrucomicrobiae bacterium]|jgi:peptidoglycan-associated lipoprotein|nr:OmpA family protein [Verrucomicrobiae bacterium]
MKTMKLIYPLAFALAITMATTGCHNHKAVKVTPIPGGINPNPGDTGGGNTLPPGSTMNPDNGANGIPVANADSFDNMTEDRAALAAYTIHFAYDSAAIKSSEQANLQSVASALSSDANAKLLIEGNCDERGTEEYNRSLGERRSLAAREALAKLGIDPSRVRTISYGKDKPADTGHDESAWKANRRDEFVLLHPKAGA